MSKRFTFIVVLVVILSFSFSFVNASAAASIQRRGMSGSQVTKLQSDLKKLGYFIIKPTGYYGSITASAVKKIQARYGLLKDGIVGNNTSALINKLLEKTKSPVTKPISENIDVSRGEADRQFVVVIDAGHGGSEPGAIYGGIKEKTLNLAIAKKLDNLLSAAGIKTYMTRDDDSYLGLYERSGLANSVDADLLISVHNNAGYSYMNGSMALYCPGWGNSKGNLTAREFASIVQRELVSDLGTNNLGIIPRPNLAVLRTTDMPAVIAEVGYMTNKSELGSLRDSTYQQNAAEALKNAVLEALKNI